jgi:hypothetical protein
MSYPMEWVSGDGRCAAPESHDQKRNEDTTEELWVTDISKPMK